MCKTANTIPIHSRPSIVAATFVSRTTKQKLTKISQPSALPPPRPQSQYLFDEIKCVQGHDAEINVSIRRLSLHPPLTPSLDCAWCWRGVNGPLRCCCSDRGTCACVPSTPPPVSEGGAACPRNYKSNNSSSGGGVKNNKHHRRSTHALVSDSHPHHQALMHTSTNAHKHKHNVHVVEEVVQGGLVALLSHVQGLWATKVQREAGGRDHSNRLLRDNLRRV